MSPTTFFNSSPALFHVRWNFRVLQWTYPSVTDKTHISVNLIDIREFWERNKSKLCKRDLYDRKELINKIQQHKFFSKKFDF